VDFLWRDWKVVGEFDGKLKYGRELREGEDPGEAVFREKIREDRLRELGYIVVRWVWDDLRQPERLAARIRRAFQLAMSVRR
jgi:very-short-patch-repair endonuclease